MKYKSSHRLKMYCRLDFIFEMHFCKGREDITTHLYVHLVAKLLYYNLYRFNHYYEIGEGRIKM